MDDLLSNLRSAFEAEGYELAELSKNRDTVRVAVREEGANPDRLRTLVTDTVDEGTVLGLDVGAESVEGADGTNTVVTVRYRD